MRVLYMYELGVWIWLNRRDAYPRLPESESAQKAMSLLMAKLLMWRPWVMKMEWVALSSRMLVQHCAKDMHRFHACILLYTSCLIHLCCMFECACG